MKTIIIFNRDCLHSMVLTQSHLFIIFRMNQYMIRYFGSFYLGKDTTRLLIQDMIYNRIETVIGPMWKSIIGSKCSSKSKNKM